MTERNQPPVAMDDFQSPVHSLSELFSADAHRSEKIYLEVETADEAGEATHD